MKHFPAYNPFYEKLKIDMNGWRVALSSRKFYESP
jgi:hypothetical protein